MTRAPHSNDGGDDDLTEAREPAERENGSDRRMVEFGRDKDRSRLPNTLEQYRALPEDTKRFLEGLKDRDIENLNAMLDLLREKPVQTLKDTVQTAQDIKTASRFIKWTTVFVLAVFAGITTVLTAIAKWTAFSNPPGGH